MNGSRLLWLTVFVLLFASGRVFADFTLPNGVSAGDVTQHSAILWTRSTVEGDVVFSVYKKVFAVKPIAGKVVRVIDINQPVKFKVDNLDAGTRYFYRVRNAAGDRLSGTKRICVPIRNRSSHAYRESLAVLRWIPNKHAELDIIKLSMKRCASTARSQREAAVNLARVKTPDSWEKRHTVLLDGSANNT